MHLRSCLLGTRSDPAGWSADFPCGPAVESLLHEIRAIMLQMRLPVIVLLWDKHHLSLPIKAIEYSVGCNPAQMYFAFAAHIGTSVKSNWDRYNRHQI